MTAESSQPHTIGRNDDAQSAACAPDQSQDQQRENSAGGVPEKTRSEREAAQASTNAGPESATKPETAAKPARPARGERPARPAREPKNEGQWALGQTDPLNANEEAKKKDDALNVRERIERIYAEGGFESIPKEDLRMRFRWWGLYTQRRAGYDGTYTGDDNIDLLEDEHFMLRIRCDGGALTLEQMRTIAGISQEFARDTADVSDRENVQLHWVRVEDMPEIWRRLENVGLYTTEACGDCPRVILGSPLAGLSKQEIIDPTPAIKEIVQRYIGNPDYSNLPRKFKSAISGLQDVAHELDDISFVGVVHPEHGPGLDLWVGGGLSTNPMFAQRVGTWVPLEEVPEVWEAVVRIFRDWGYRRLRAKARLKFLIKDWGIEKFREVLESEAYLGRKLIDGPAPEPIGHPIDHVGEQELKDGSWAVGYSPIAGRVTGSLLLALTEAAEQVGARTISFTPYQKIIVIGVPHQNLVKLRSLTADLGLETKPSVWRRNLMACTGIEFCKLSFTETRKRSQTLVPELEKRLSDIESQIDAPITINLNGCPNSCARSQIADIGFKGQLVDDENNNTTEGFQVHLGGSLGLEADFGRKLRGHKVTSAELGEYVERVVRNYYHHRESGEKFASWARRADEELLR